MRLVYGQLGPAAEKEGSLPLIVRKAPKIELELGLLVFAGPILKPRTAGCVCAPKT